ncbi:hypothetical protein [Synechococcus sp. MIT S9509]|uniref:hypothetical protein n=1 Tax=Synechococcus sp. MIT S9509 TaxID=1801630 RepID=UPI0039AEDA68
MVGAPSVLGGVRIEKADYVPCRVADWRVTFHEPADMKAGPEIPADAQWGAGARRSEVIPMDFKSLRHG